MKKSSKPNVQPSGVRWLCDASWRISARAARGRDKIKAMREYMKLFSCYERIDKLVALIEHEPRYIFWPIFNAFWPYCEHSRFNTLPDAVVDGWNERLHTAMQRVGPHASVKRLPTNLTIYRGGSRSRIAALAWTTDVKVARRFADGRLVADPVVARTRIDRSEVFWCNDEWCEYELVCWPTRWDIIEEKSNG